MINEEVVNISSLINEGVARVMMSGVFGISSRSRFKEVTDPLLVNDKVSSIAIEMGQVTDIGTSGMGMLYLLQEKCSTSKKDLKILHPVGKVKRWLKIANTSDIFDLQAN